MQRFRVDLRFGPAHSPHEPHLFIILKRERAQGASRASPGTSKFLEIYTAQPTTPPIPHLHPTPSPFRTLPTFVKTRHTNLKRTFAPVCYRQVRKSLKIRSLVFAPNRAFSCKSASLKIRSLAFSTKSRVFMQICESTEE